MDRCFYCAASQPRASESRLEIPSALVPPSAGRL
jgi:hypothetical protein